jgi:hypothetical protein
MICIKKTLLFTSIILIFSLTSKTQAVQVLEQKIIAAKVNDWDIHWAKLIFDNNDNVLITMKGLFYIDDKLTSTRNLSEYCCDILGGYVKDNHFFIVLNDINSLDVYRVQKEAKLESYIKPLEKNSDYDGVVVLPEQDDSYYIFGHYSIGTLNPLDNLKAILPMGRITFDKPFLAKIENNKVVSFIKLNYGGKTDESYIVQEAVAGKDSIHFFGFRNIDVPSIGSREPIQLVDSGTNDYAGKAYNFDTGDYYSDSDITRSVILYYSNYNLKKEKNTRNCKIYENTPGYNKKTDTYCDYGVLSADTKGDDAFAVFSWVKWQRHRAGSTMVKYRGLQHKEGFSLNDVNSSIYFWQCSDKSYGSVEKIAEGFCPIVKVDQFGSVHVFWIDRGGNVVQKVRKNNNWSSEEIILKGISAKPIIYTKHSYSAKAKDRPEAILYTKFFAAEFDKDNNLHAVYPTAEGIVYTKLKLE